MPLYAAATAYTNILNFLSPHRASASGSASPELILNTTTTISPTHLTPPIPTAHSPLPHAEIIIRHRRPKPRQHHDLQHNARNNAPIPMHHQTGILERRAGRQRAADGLDEQARDVERDKDERVQARRDARQRRVERQADVLEGQVDGDAHEGGREDDGDDLRLEGVLVPGVGGERDARGVAYREGEG